MKFITRLIGIVLFVLFFGFALKNTQGVVLHLFWGYEFSGPLVLLLLGFLGSGALLGVLAMTPMALRQRRELNKLHKTLQIVQNERAAAEAVRNAPPQPDAINSVLRELI
jgi:putative membrane protein